MCRIIAKLPSEFVFAKGEYYTFHHKNNLAQGHKASLGNGLTKKVSPVIADGPSQVDAIISGMNTESQKSNESLDGGKNTNGTINGEQTRVEDLVNLNSIYPLPNLWKDLRTSRW